MEQENGGDRTSGKEESDRISGVVPYRNVPALVAYYLGLFSFIPFLGILLGLSAFVLGIMGLKRVAKQPEAKGKVHAWIGIILGGLFGFGYLVLVTIMLLGD